LSESADFAEAVQAAGLVFIGPSASAIRQMGVKTVARSLMEAAQVPVVPGFQSDTATTADFLHAAERIGYPIMVKAAGGGGGKGIRIVYQATDLLDAIDTARREAFHAFNDATVFLERYIEKGRHIEVQVLADAHGNVVHLFERECSIQRRHQKIVEETPSPLLTPEIRSQMGQAAVNAARAVGYVNAGTVEFIADQNANFYFLEMNTRLQVEHPITELVVGVDLVKLQIRIAAGETLPFRQNALGQRGHAIECRLYAEDPANNFLPAIGKILKLVEPSGPNIRWDSGVVSGDDISIYYDPMIAKLIVWAENRPQAIERMLWALRQTVLLGLETNLHFLQDVLRHSVFMSGQATTHFIDDHLQGWQHAETTLPHEALIVAALGEFLQMQGGGASANAGTMQTGADAYSPWGHADGFRMG
jgi:acetyl/propionyl-CoA carboxylase alpha subunit